MSTPEPPAGLEASGMSLWNAVVERYVLTPAELANLAEAARTADELSRLEAAVRNLPELTTTGSTGQIRPHPLLSEVRQHRALLRSLTEALDLPDQDQQVGLRAGARRTQKAVQARWANREVS